MRYRQLGTTGTQVSVLCLGAMTFGEALARLDSVSAPELGYPYDFMKNIDGGW